MLQSAPTPRGLVVCIAADESIVQAQAMVLRRVADLQIRIETDATAGIRHFTTQLPTVLLVDERLHGTSGIELCQSVARAHPYVARLMTSVSKEMAPGVDAVLSKPVRPEILHFAATMGVTLANTRRRLTQSDPDEPHPPSVVRAQLAHEVRNMLMPATVELDRIAKYARELASREPDRTDALIASVLAQRVMFEQLHGLMARLARSEVDLGYSNPATVAASVVRRLRQTLPESVSIDATLQSTQLVEMDAPAIAQIAMNLLLNAARVLTKRGHGTIQLSVKDVGTQVQLRIEDNGPGFPHYLLSDSQSQGPQPSGGHGLSIVRALCSAAGADFKITNDGLPVHGSAGKPNGTSAQTNQGGAATIHWTKTRSR